jgi:hypothetical protein
MILAADGGGGSKGGYKPPKKTKVLGASSRKPAAAPKARQHGGERDTTSDRIGVRNTGRGVQMPEMLSGIHEAAYRLYMQSQPKKGDKAQQKKAKAAEKALRDLFNI